MGCTRGCLRCLIGVTSVVLLLIAVICLAFGIFLMTAFSGLVNSHLGPQIGEVKTLTNQFNYVGGTEKVCEDLDLKPLVEPLAICLIVIGVVIFVIGILGLIGTCCSSRLVLFVYALVLAAVIAVQVILIILFFTKALDPQIRKQVEKKLIEPYKGLGAMCASSMAASVLMYRYKCCGIDSYEDFSKAKDWKNTLKTEVNSRQITVNLTTPIACCKMNDGNVVDQRCAEKPSDTNSNWKTGCWGEVAKELKGHRTKAIAVIVVIILVEVALFVMAIAVVCLLKDNKVADW